MKKVLLGCLFAWLLIACSKKDLLKWIGKPGNPKPSVPCRIDSLYPVEKGDPMLHGWLAAGIHYNANGNPAVINYTQQYLDTFHFTVYYKYDSKNRLIEVDPPVVDPVLMEVAWDSPVTPHKFVYEGNSVLPVRDSILSDTFSGIWEGKPYQAYTVKIEDLYYDSHGRVNRVVTRRTYTNTLYPPFVDPDQETIFSYDSKGNRQIVAQYGSTPPAITYTNKPSLFSLHPVWQLLHKNWSKNAPAQNVFTFNSYGLPTKLEFRRETFLHTGSGEGGSPFNIYYTCM